MKRQEITAFLSALLEKQRFSCGAKYWAREVTLDFGSKNSKRIDYLQFVPPTQMSVSELEKGKFIAYEVKSCKEDFKSKNGHNLVGEQNYYVLPMQTYKEVGNEIPAGTGVLCPVPYKRDKFDEWRSPTPLETECFWQLEEIVYPHQKLRTKSLTELLFCMVRSGK